MLSVCIQVSFRKLLDLGEKIRWIELSTFPCSLVSSIYIHPTIPQPTRKVVKLLDYWYAYHTAKSSEVCVCVFDFEVWQFYFELIGDWMQWSIIELLSRKKNLYMAKKQQSKKMWKRIVILCYIRASWINVKKSVVIGFGNGENAITLQCCSL